ncbi:class I SAM-dependent methyltransferase [Prochlorococcus sp. MIT 0604]|uniref:class I SAM-dependent methyltransferase n=1 Tax=Prochlorococcus sp. MIT 0604 TaxID=1501268 RepID=UPI0004F64BAB|nr:class I SAM-dependent methyltransferase [Prochlorococcus sp. MIT 0604]AIQ95485.1 hypothetical protein EW14_1474 [Prochlorococcus sp. MIT 0604]
MSNLKLEQFGKLLIKFSEYYFLKSHIKWLEIGCGNGNLTHYLISKGKSGFGIDVEFKEGNYKKILINNNQIKLINSNGKSRSEILEENQCYSWPCKSNSIDFAFSSSVIEHIINLEEFIKENARILQQGGYCLHYFPARTAIFEAHTGVPFGGLIINKFYYNVMFNLRLCNASFNNAEEIYQYMKKSTNYISKRKLIYLFSKYNLKFIYEENSLTIKYMGPKLTRFLSRSKLFCYFFGIFRSKLMIFRKYN